MAQVLEGEAALVTGGGSGIGLASARVLAADGAAVVLAGRTASKLDEAAERLRTEVPGAVVATAVCDVAEEEQVEAAVRLADGLAPGGLRRCVASAGVGWLSPIVSTAKEAWDAVMAVNLTGAFLTVKHAGGAMAARGGGAVVAISSIASPLTHRYMAAYCVSKAGLDALVRNAADELGSAGVRVCSVQPSLVPTDIAAGLAGDPASVEEYLRCMPVARLGTVDDVAAAVRFLVGPESGWITGQCLPVDGGHTLRRGPDLTHIARALYPGQFGVPAGT